MSPDGLSQVGVMASCKYPDKVYMACMDVGPVEVVISTYIIYTWLLRI